MRYGKSLLERHIRKIIKEYLREEEEGGGNPFAAAAGEEGGGEEGGEDSGGGEAAADTGGDEGGEEGGEEEKTDTKKGEAPQGVPVKFNISRVKKYNNAKFLGDEGILKSISKKGLVVTVQPDNVDILVNFDDITESVKKFFKKRR
jgi:hypothetical protein